MDILNPHDFHLLWREFKEELVGKIKKVDFSNRIMKREENLTEQSQNQIKTDSIRFFF